MGKEELEDKNQKIFVVSDKDNLSGSTNDIFLHGGQFNGENESNQLQQQNGERKFGEKDSSITTSNSSLEDELETIDLYDHHHHNKIESSSSASDTRNHCPMTEEEIPSDQQKINNNIHEIELEPTTPTTQQQSTEQVDTSNLNNSEQQTNTNTQSQQSLKPDNELSSNVDSNSPSRTSTFITEELSPKSILIIFSGLMVSLSLSSLDMTIVATALPAIVEDLGSLDKLSWVVTIYLLTSTSASPLFGKFSDIFGRKAMLIFSLIVFLIGSLLCALSYSMVMLIMARAIQGIGGGGLMSAVMIVMAEIVPLRERGKYQGLLGAVYALSSVIGPLMGGTFTDNITWRWAFWINLPLGAVALVVVFFALKLPHDVIPVKKGILRIDFLGTLTLVSAVVSFLLALSWGGIDYGWDSPIIIGLLGGSFGLLIVFVINEIFFTKHPIIPMILFTNRNYIICSLGSFFLGFIMFGVIYYIPLYFQIVKGESATLSGLQLLPTMLGIVIFGCISGLLIVKFGHYKSYPIFGTFLMTIGTFLLSIWSTNSPMSQYIGFQAIIGIGIGLTMQILVLIVQNSVEYKYISISTATISFFRSIGGVVSVSLFNTILNQQFQKNLNSLVLVDPDILKGTPASEFGAEQIRTFQGYGKTNIIEAYSQALSIVFLSATPFAGAACALIIFVKAKKLRTTLASPQQQQQDNNNNGQIETVDPNSDGTNNDNINNTNQQQQQQEIEIEIINENQQQEEIELKISKDDIPFKSKRFSGNIAENDSQQQQEVVVIEKKTNNNNNIDRQQQQQQQQQHKYINSISSDEHENIEIIDEAAIEMIHLPSIAVIQQQQQQQLNTILVK
eukprot:gene4740-5916_t